MIKGGQNTMALHINILLIMSSEVYIPIGTLACQGDDFIFPEAQSNYLDMLNSGLTKR